MDLKLVSSQVDDSEWYRNKLESSLKTIDPILITIDLWNHSFVTSINEFTNEHYGTRTVLDFSNTPTIVKLELKWHLAHILIDERYNSRSKTERRRHPITWFTQFSNEILNQFSTSCIADIPHPSYPPAGMTKSKKINTHNNQLLAIYKNHDQTSTYQEFKQTYVKSQALVEKEYESPRTTILGDIHKKIVIAREQFKPISTRNIVLLNDLYSEDDYRFKDKQRSTDQALNFYLYPAWMRDAVKQHVLLKIEHGELAPSTLPNYFGRLTKFRDFLYETFEHPTAALITTTLVEDNYISWGNEKGYTGKNWFTDVVAFLNTAAGRYPDTWPSLSVSPRAAGKIEKVHYKKGLGRIGHNQESSVKSYSQTELDSIAAACSACSHPIAEIFALILATGIRCEDGHAILYDCLSNDPNDPDFMLLTFWQNKVRKWNVKPLLKRDPNHARLIETVEKQRTWINIKYKQPTKYLFPQFSGSKESFTDQTYTGNEIRKQCVIKAVQRDNGTPLPFHWHALRHTKGTSMAEDGQDILSIMMELGHTSPDMATAYVNNRLELKKNALMQHGSGRFFTIEGKVDDRVKELLVRKDEIKATRVCGGACSMPAQIGDWCAHANACYSCKYFRADEKDVDFFRREKTEIQLVIESQESDIIDLTENGQTRMTEITTKRLKENKVVFKNLDSIINAIDEDGEFAGTESNVKRKELT